jgi:hypothetical protein
LSGGNFEALSNTAALTIDYNLIGKNMQVQNNNTGGGGLDVSSNQITKNLQCQNNNPAPTHVGLNMAGGQNQGQCADR